MECLRGSLELDNRSQIKHVLNLVVANFQQLFKLPFTLALDAITKATKWTTAKDILELCRKFESGAFR